MLLVSDQAYVKKHDAAGPTGTRIVSPSSQMATNEHYKADNYRINDPQGIPTNLASVFNSLNQSRMKPFLEAGLTQKNMTEATNSNQSLTNIGPNDMLIENKYQGQYPHYKVVGKVNCSFKESFTVATKFNQGLNRTSRNRDSVIDSM